MLNLLSCLLLRYFLFFCGVAQHIFVLIAAIAGSLAKRERMLFIGVLKPYKRIFINIRDCDDNEAVNAASFTLGQPRNVG